MFDPKLYHKACDGMSLDAARIEEMISMTENQEKKAPARRPLRVAMLAAAVVTALGITASASEIPAVQEFFASIFVTVTSTGDEVAGLNLPSVGVIEREGCTILFINEEETDITEALREHGEYSFEGDGFKVQVDQNGVAVVTAYGNDGTVVTYSTEDMSGDGAIYNISDEKDASFTVKSGDISEDVAWGAYNVVTDQNGEMVVSGK